MNPSTDEGAGTATWSTHPVFRLDNQKYSIRDVLDAAHVCGDLEKRWKEFLIINACEDHGRQNKAALDLKMVESLRKEFLRARDIITAEETGKWLANNLILPEQFQRHFERGYWLSQFERDVTPQLVELIFASSDPWNEFRIHLTLSGELEAVSRRLARRICVAHHAQADRSKVSAAIQLEREQFKEREGIRDEQLVEWIASKDRSIDWLELQFEFEALYKLGCEEKLSAENQARALAALGTALIQFEYEILEFDSAEALKAAHQRITLEGISTQDLAQENGFRYRKTHSFLEFLPDSLRQSFLRADVGDLISSEEEQCRLFHIMKKSAPTIDDPTVKRHLQRRLLGTFLTDLESKHVQWLLRFAN